MDEIPLAIKFILGILALAAAGALIGAIILVLGFVLWLASLPLRLLAILLGILPGLWR